jgi:hypothetical protein
MHYVIVFLQAIRISMNEASSNPQNTGTVPAATTAAAHTPPIPPSSISESAVYSDVYMDEAAMLELALAMSLNDSAPVQTASTSIIQEEHSSSINSNLNNLTNFPDMDMELNDFGSSDTISSTNSNDESDEGAAGQPLSSLLARIQNALHDDS